ncbi:MAG: DUF3352 domain-containing protein [Cyanobacteria bacterium J06621_11]
MTETTKRQTVGETTEETTGETATARASAASGPDRFGKKFRNVLLVGSLCLLLLGGVGFAYLRAMSPLTLLSGSRRPIAAATAFVPQKSLFTFSLLAPPDELIDLQQAVVPPESRAQAREEISRVQQNLLQATGLSYERDIQPWLGSEITFAYTDLDVDQEAANGQQPGRFLILEIAPGQQPLAKSFLQLFWQQQVLAGNPASVQQVNGIRILSGRSAGITTASALVGEQFVMFASDVSVLRHSFQSAQTAKNLAQSAEYRRQVAELPAARIGLAYFDTQLFLPERAAGAPLGQLPNQDLNSDFTALNAAAPKFVAMSLALTRNGLRLTAGEAGEMTKPSANDRLDLLEYLPAASELTIVGKDFSQLPLAEFVVSASSSTLSSSVTSSSVASSAMSNRWFAFLAARSERWSQTNYAIARLSAGRSADWILATERNPAQMEALDSAAKEAGYSVVPIEIGDEIATAWTRFKTRTRRQSGRQGRNQSGGGGLDTEVLGLHLQQGDHEILTNSLQAMQTALSAPQNSLLESPQFVQSAAVQSTAAFPGEHENFAYADWPVVSPSLARTFPIVTQIQAVIGPWMKHVGAIAATFDTGSADVFIQFSEVAPSQRTSAESGRVRSGQSSITTY